MVVVHTLFLSLGRQRQTVWEPLGLQSEFQAWEDYTDKLCLEIYKNRKETEIWKQTTGNNSSFTTAELCFISTPHRDVVEEKWWLI